MTVMDIAWNITGLVVVWAAAGLFTVAIWVMLRGGRR